MSNLKIERSKNVKLSQKQTKTLASTNKKRNFIVKLTFLYDFICFPHYPMPELFLFTLFQVKTEILSCEIKANPAETGDRTRESEKRKNNPSTRDVSYENMEKVTQGAIKSSPRKKAKKETPREQYLLRQRRDI